MARGELRFPTADGAPAPDEEVHEAAAALGLEIEGDLALDEEFYLWPECQPAFRLYLQLGTQWMVAGMGGRCGLNYAGVEACMRMSGIARREWPELFGCIQAMEAAALKVWSDEARKNQQG